MAQIPTTRPEALELAKSASRNLLAAKAQFAVYLEEVEALAEYAQTMDIDGRQKGAAFSAFRVSQSQAEALDRMHDRVLQDLRDVDAEAGDVVVQSR